MKPVYHLSITRITLSSYFSPFGLDVILKANVSQDKLAGQFGHPEFHFDDSAFDQGNDYLALQRELVLASLEHDRPPLAAWQAFGRLTHAAQDIYAHSNYVDLWLEKHPSVTDLTQTEIDPADPAVLSDPGLRSGRNYLPFDLPAYLPLVGNYFRYLVPRDGHVWMNLDDPSRGERFLIALTAATKRTLWEYQHLVDSFPKAKKVAWTANFSDL